MTKKQLINLEPVRAVVREKLLEKYDTTMYMNTDKIDLTIDISEILDNYLEEKHIEEPDIYITADAYLKMRTLVLETSTEIGWYGIVNHDIPGFPNAYVIEDIIVYPQRVTGATCEQDEDKMFEFEMSLTTEQVNNKRFHGHSHVNMSTGPSGVDESFYQDLLSQVKDYFIIAINNKAGSLYTRFYDVENNVMYTDVPIKVMLTDGALLDNWYTAAKERLHTPTATVPTKTKQPSLYDTESVWDKYYDDYYNWHEDDEIDPLVWEPSLTSYIRRSEQQRIRKAERAVKKVKKGAA